MADDLRQDVLNLLSQSETFLDELSNDLQFILDDEAGKCFPSVHDRIRSVNRTGYAGYLEIFALAYILDSQFKIFVERQNGSYALQCAVPAASCSSSSICLLYHIDSASHPGHYDLLLQKAQCEAEVQLVAGELDRLTDRKMSFECFVKRSLSFENAPAEVTDNEETADKPDGDKPTDAEIAGEVGLSKVNNEESAQKRELSSFSDDNNECDSRYPSIWTSKQVEDFTTENPWLCFSKGSLGCKTCQQVTNYGAFRKQGLKISKQ